MDGLVIDLVGVMKRQWRRTSLRLRQGWLPPLATTEESRRDELLRQGGGAKPATLSKRN